MQIALPHDLPRAVIRQRLQSGDHDIAKAIPGGMIEVVTSWPEEDRMAMAINAMGQAIAGEVRIEDAQVVFEIDLPLMLGFAKPMVENAIRQQGERLLAPVSG